MIIHQTWSIVCSTLAEAVVVVDNQISAEDAVQDGDKRASIPVVGHTTSVVALSNQVCKR